MCSFFFSYVKQKLSYWSSKGVPHLPPSLWTLGINFRPFTEGPEQYTGERTALYGKVYGAYGLLNPFLIVNDARLIKQIMVKDFTLFMDKPELNTWDKVWNRNLFVTGGDSWKRIRTIVR